MKLANKIRLHAVWLLAVLYSLVSLSAYAQVEVITTTTIYCRTPVPQGAKVEYDWYADSGLTLTTIGNGSAANPSGPDGTYDGVVVATVNGQKTPTAFSVTIGDTPEPPQPDSLRDLVTDAEAVKVAAYLRAFVDEVPGLKTPEEFWLLFDAAFPASDNAALVAALKSRLGPVLSNRPLELTKELRAIADEIAISPPVPPEPEPDPPIVTTGQRAVVIVHETGDNNPDFGSLQIALQRPNGTSQKYLKSGGHTLQILDDELPGKWSDLLKGRAAGMTLPALFIIDPKTNEILFGQSIPNTYTADQVIERLRENGG